LDLHNILELDKAYYSLKHDLMSFNPVSPVIKDKLFMQKDHKYYGISSCITQYEDYVFVGNSTGIIRVFDWGINKEMKPMMDPKLEKNKVTSIYLTEDGKYLLSGYKKGTLVIWNMVDYKLVKIIEDAHVTEVTSAKIYNITPEEVI
jgi:WD40 repeat protein